MLPAVAVVVYAENVWVGAGISTGVDADVTHVHHRQYSFIL
jgi:hypothetical protein